MKYRYKINLRCVDKNGDKVKRIAVFKTMKEASEAFDYALNTDEWEDYYIDLTCLKTGQILYLYHEIEKEVEQ